MLLSQFFGSLISSACLLCRRTLRGIKPLCAVCEHHLPWNTQACLRCAIPLVATEKYCGHCLQSPPIFSSAVCAFRYEEPVAGLLNRYKHSGQLACGHWLAHSLAQHIRDSERAGVLILPECILPVPLHWRRLQQRGFDQGAEIARVLARQLHLPLSRALARQRNTDSQQGLSRQQRQTNLNEAFILQRPLPYRRVAVVDDVLTTGSTATEIVRVLSAAGVDEVQVWAIARTP
ncbi:MAG: ComF family protein [Pseudomonadales bacterium]